MIGLGRAVRLALAIHAAEYVVRRGPLNVVADQQVKVAVRRRILVDLSPLRHSRDFPLLFWGQLVLLIIASVVVAVLLPTARRPKAGGPVGGGTGPRSSVWAGMDWVGSWSLAGGG